MIEIKGTSPLDIDLRTEALKKVNQLPTEVLTRLAELAESKKARNYLTTKSGFKIVKTFLGI